MVRFISLFLLGMLFMPPACAQTQKLISRQTTDYFMTASALFVYADAQQEADFPQTWSLVKQTLDQVEKAVSVSYPDSDIARFNALHANEEIQISAITADILRIAADVYALSDGLYDPTVYPLVDLWGFSPRFNANAYRPALPYDRAYENGQLPLPNPDHISTLRQLIGLEGIALREEDGAFFLRKNTPSVWIGGTEIPAQLDLGGIAKGYACDLIMDILRERGYTCGRFVCGGSSMALLEQQSGDGAYTVALQKPRKGENSDAHFATLKARNITLSTSGDTSHCFTRDGVVYCHMIDPRTGYPINMPDADGMQHGIVSATLLYASAAYGDALTTALCVLGPGQAQTLLNRIGENTAVLSVYHSDRAALEVLSNAGADELTISDPAYQMICFQGD